MVSSVIPAPEPFRIDIPSADVADLRRRIASTRLAPDFANETWRYGVERKYLASFLDYWGNDYDWSASERRLNEYPQFKVVLDEIILHYLHVHGVGPRPTPIVLLHGWPWTYWDFQDVIGPLSNPAAHGSDAADAFDVVVVSLPGFAFSSPLRNSGVSAGLTAELVFRLMTEILGYDRFGIHGGDWGGSIASRLAHAHPDEVIGIQLSGCYLAGPGYVSSRLDVQPDDYGADELHYAETMAARMQDSISHRAVADHDPQTLAYALEDSPAGLAAWLLERRRSWSDCDGDVERAFSREFLATMLCLYWFTHTIGSSMRFYRDASPFSPIDDSSPTVPVPTGISVFPRDVVQLPRRFAARHCDLRRWTLMPVGGHFGAAEQPDLVAEEIRALFRILRENGRPAP